MRVFLRDEVFASHGAELVEFFMAAVNDRHLVAVDEEGACYTAWLGRRSGEDQDAVRFAIESSLKPNARVVLEVALEARSDWSLSPPRVTVDDALALMRLPLQVLVENSESDRAFLLAMASREQREVLERAERQRRLEFVQGGGIPEVLKRIRRDRDRDPGRLLITFVLADSDALLRGCASAEAREVRKECLAAHVPHHVLRRRSAENYLTMGALHGYVYRDTIRQPQREPLFQAFLSLSRLQRWHYHMKDGFRKASHRLLFSSVGSADLSALHMGWGDHVASLFGDGSVQEHDLLREGALRELRPVLNLLIALLR